MSILFEGLKKKQRKTKSRKVSASIHEYDVISEILDLSNFRMEDGDDFYNAFNELLLQIVLTSADPTIIEDILQGINKHKNALYSYDDENAFYVYLGDKKSFIKDVEELADEFLDDNDKKMLYNIL